MDEYSIFGRVIGPDHAPIGGVRVEIWRRAELRRTEEVVGNTRTDPGGRFELALDRREAGGLLARLGESVPIFLVLRDEWGKEILKTRAVPIGWQLEYRIYLGGGRRVVKAPDPYKAAPRRMISGTRESGMADRMRSARADPSDRTGWVKQAIFAEPTESSGTSLNLLFAVADGTVAGSLETPRLQLVEYDGPQVPRTSWEAPDDQAVIWSRHERFRWE